MSGAVFPVLEAAARLLSPEEREVVLGDLAEAGEGGGRAVWAILELLARKQFEHWREWGPWLGAAGALLGTLLLLGASFGVAMRARALPSRELWTFELLPICQLLLLFAWSWTTGYMIGFLSRRTVWVSALLCITPCLCCLLRFREPSLSPFCVLLFLAPGLFGALYGMRSVRLRMAFGVALVAGVTILTFACLPWNLWNLPLMFSSWFVAFQAYNSEGQKGGLTE